MVGSFLTRILVMVFGYAYPAYECFKTIEKNKLEIEQLRFWCQYWILIAMITVFERVGDTFLSWVPMYSEAKVAFLIYLWCPKTKGTTYVYDSFFRPYLAKHETEIDRNLLELRARCADFAVQYWQKAASYGQTRVLDIIQYVSAQSTTRLQPTQQATGKHPPAVRSNPQPATTTETPQQPPTRTSSWGRKKQQKDPPPAAQAAVTAPALPVAGAPTPPAAVTAPALPVAGAPTPPAAAMPSPIKEGDEPSMESKSEIKQNEAEAMDTDVNSSYEIVKAPPTETVMEETIRETRLRLRKTRSAAAAAANQ